VLIISNYCFKGYETAKTDQGCIEIWTPDFIQEIFIKFQFYGPAIEVEDSAPKYDMGRQSVNPPHDCA
jgi:hypothetical protein